MQLREDEGGVELKGCASARHKMTRLSESSLFDPSSFCNAANCVDTVCVNHANVANLLISLIWQAAGCLVCIRACHFKFVCYMKS